MNYTSAQAAKLLSRLQQEYDQLAAHEENARTFLASVGEDVESVRPVYSYEETGAQLEALEAKIRKVKHAINVFNTATVIPEFNMTIDEMLVYIPQLSKKKAKLKEMANKLPKVRYNNSYAINIIDYLYVNYDLKAVNADLEAVTEELSAAQLALDAANHTATLDIEI